VAWRLVTKAAIAAAMPAGPGAIAAAGWTIFCVSRSADLLALADQPTG